MLRARLQRVPPRLRPPLAALIYALLWAGLFEVSQLYWYLPAGLRFGALLLAPRRWWPWLIGAEWITDLLMHMSALNGLAGPWYTLPAMVIPQPLAVALVVALLRRRGLSAWIDTPERSMRLLVGALLAALVSTAVNWPVLDVLVGMPLAQTNSVLANFALGDYLGILLIAPLMLMLLRTPPDRAQMRYLFGDVLLILLPILLVLTLLMGEGAVLARYARVLTLVPVLFFAFRHGWRGANLAMLASGIVIALYSGQPRPEAPAEAQLFLAVAGTGALLLGVATDALRQSGLRQALQNARLGTANQRLDQLARQLETAARRSLLAEEGERKRIAAELHDELGQNLTAIQVRVRIALPRLESAGLGDVASGINDIVATMRRSVRGLLDTLRPAALVEFGLARALAEGPVREMLRSASVEYHFEQHGDLRVLDDALRITLYRIVQEAATNCVRHARAQRFSVRLRCGVHAGRTLALLDVRDDGVGLAAAAGPLDLGRGLNGMRERVLALGGSFRVAHCVQGVRLRILLAQPLSA